MLFSTVLDDYPTYALDLLGDLLLNSIFLTDNLEREMCAILREMKMSRDVPVIILILRRLYVTTQAPRGIVIRTSGATKNLAQPK